MSDDPWAAFAPQAIPIGQTGMAAAPQDPWAAFSPQPAPQSEMKTLGERVAPRLAGIADNVARTLARGATFGFADELAAAGNATVGVVTGQPGTWNERYSAGLASERGRDAAFDANNPALSLVGQGVGAMASGAPVMSAARSLIGAVGGGVATGAGYGALSGFGQGEGGFVPRALNAAEGAAVGGAIGGALPLALAGAGAVGGLASRAVSPNARNADAQRLMLRDLSRDGMTPQELLQSSQAAGSAPVALVDLAGENVRQAGQAVARVPGPGQTMATNLLRERAGPQQADRVRAAIREAISGDDFAETIAATTQRRRAEAAPNYERAYSRTLPADPRLQQFISDPDVRRGIEGGIASARREALARGEDFDLAAYGVQIGENGAIRLLDGATPTRLFDAAKRGLDQLEESARTGVGGATSQSREIADLRRAMLARVDELNPDYAAARAAYAGDSALLAAARDGRRLATVKPEDFELSAADLRRMSPSERDFFRMGVARGLVDRVNSTADGAEGTRLRQLFGTPFMREKLQATFDNPEDFARFSRTMEQEIGIASTNRAIDPRGGSPTMPLQERRQDLANPPRGAVMGSVAPREPGEGGGMALGTLGRSLLGMDASAAIGAAGQLGRMNSASNFERNTARLAETLFTSAPAERSRLAEELIRRALRDEAARGVLGPIARGSARSAGAAGGYTDTPLLNRQPTNR